MERTTSSKLFSEACQIMPGGVSSPVRAFRAVEGNPLFIIRAKGSRIFDVDGNSFIDYVGSWGPMILGHARQEIIDAVRHQAGGGLSFGAPTTGEIKLARMITERVPGAQMVRFVNSGTESCMSAVRLARGYTGRDKIIKFEGCYHGHADALLAEAGSGAATMSIPGSAGVPKAAFTDTLVVPFNDVQAVQKAVSEAGDSLAAIIVEPVAGNMGVVPPAEGFLQVLRDVTHWNGSLLIFDEVMTGFRLSRGGAAELYGITPDLVTLGKVVGAGMPLAAYAGRQDIMEQVSPLGPVYQAGTLSGNPLATAAGAAGLELLTPSVYQKLEETSDLLEQGLAEAIAESGAKAQVQRVGSMLTLFFTPTPVVNFKDAKASDTRLFAKFHHLMLQRGFYLPPSQFEAWFVSAAHSLQDIEQTLQAARESLQALKEA